MALGLDGLKIKRFSEIISDIQTRLEEEGTGLVITDESNKLVNNLGNIFSLALAENNEFIEEVYNAFDIYSASGVALDRLVAFKNIKRFSADYTKGLVEFTCNGLVDITPSTQLKDDRGRSLYANESTKLGTGKFKSYYIGYTPTAPLTVGVKYYIVMNGVEFAHTATSGETFQDLMLILSASIDSTSDYESSLADNKLHVKYVNCANVSVITHPDFTITEYSAVVEFRSEGVGIGSYPANTIQTLVTNLPNVSSVNNPEDFRSGREIETDEDLRTRFLNTSGASGRSTVDSIINGVLSTPSVTDVYLINNKEDTTSAEGLPPKSFEVIVQGGEDQDVADAILAYAPVGIEIFGNTLVSSADSKGVLHPIRFTRPSDVYIFINVEYEKYEDFESFPADGEDIIRQTLAELTSTYQPSQDVVPSALKTPLYKAVTGLGELRVTCGFSTNASDTSPTGGYSENRVSIGIRQLANISSTRIAVTETNIT